MIHHHMARAILKDYAYNPVTQYRFHLVMCFFWLLNFAALVVIAARYMVHNLAAVGGAYLIAISIYSCLDTDYGAMSAALAARQTEPAEIEHDFAGE